MATAGPQGGGYYQHHHPMTLEEVRTLWIGDLQYWFDENYLSSCFAHTGEVSLSRFHFIKIGKWDVCDGFQKIFIVNQVKSKILRVPILWIVVEFIVGVWISLVAMIPLLLIWLVWQMT